MEDQDPHHVVIVGAGISGLSLALELARLWNNEKNSDNHARDDVINVGTTAVSSIIPSPLSSSVQSRTSSNDEKGTIASNNEPHHLRCTKRQLKITIVEANSCVGGRVRTIQTSSNNNISNNSNTSSESVVSLTSTNSKSIEPCSTTSFVSLSPSNQVKWKQRYQAFSPWTISLGAEFVHGDERNYALVDDIIRKQQQKGKHHQEHSPSEQDNNQWEMELILDFSKKFPNLIIFANGMCFDWYDGKESKSCNPTSLSRHWTTLIQKSKEIWDDIIMAMNELDLDMSLEEYVNMHYYKKNHKKCQNDDQSNSKDVLSILNAVHAITAGTNSHHLGVKETSRQDNLWSYGERNFRLGGCFSELVVYFLMELEGFKDSKTETSAILSSSARNVNSSLKLNDNTTGQSPPASVTVEIITNCSVDKIECTKLSNVDSLYIPGEQQNPINIDNTKKVKVAGSRQVFECDRVAVTIPLATLKSNTIHFAGDCKLTKEKIHAIKTINMMPGGKVHALMKWGVDLILTDFPQGVDYNCISGIFICPQDELFSQVWFRWRDGCSILATGLYVYEKEVNDAVTMEKSFQDLVKRILSEAIGPSIFPTPDGNDTLTFSAFDVYDWSKDKYVQGLYSSPSVGAFQRKQEDDEITHSEEGMLCWHLSTPLTDCVFFAGEHTHTETNATVQSALERGNCVAHEIYDSLMNCSSP